MLNLGSGNLPLNGFTNVDLTPPADIVGDFLEMTFTDVEEVEMSHVLEHIPHRRTEEALLRIHTWMVPAGTIRVEVPDCSVLCAMDLDDPTWQQWMFGSQESPGQFHRAGFTAFSLKRALMRAGWTLIGARTFASDNVNRPGYPCVEVTAAA